MFPEVHSVEYQTLPFDHFVASVTNPDSCGAWLEWLEKDAPWELTVTDFYEQYEFSLLHVRLPPVVGLLACRETLESLRSRMFHHFGILLSERVDVTAHKLLTNQTIRIHNDYIPGAESHRLLLQLNREWHPQFGGLLMLFKGSSPETISKIVEPRHGSVQAFAISPRSYHAVSTVHGGERFTVVYSFYPDNR
ncbi:MAG: 2OG-Fe(II) oxygenase [Aestuariivita sp.]|nr:2OG-Fe(II) oxygenase [Aestuariivita sp.]